MRNVERFAIADDVGNIIDDANGYGYKTEQKAKKAIWYKFNGGKEKINKKEKEKKEYFKQNPGLEKFIEEMYECYFKELHYGERDEQDLLDEIKEHFNIDMPKEYLF